MLTRNPNPRPLLQRGSPEFTVLHILAGCPTGASEYNLVTRHDVSPAVLYRLVDRGLIMPETRTIRPPYGWPIVWLVISDTGRAALAELRS